MNRQTNSTCIICQDKYTIIKFQCGHACYCLCCLEAFLTHNANHNICNRCPLCRIKIDHAIIEICTTCKKRRNAWHTLTRYIKQSIRRIYVRDIDNSRYIDSANPDTINIHIIHIELYPEIVLRMHGKLRNMITEQELTTTHNVELKDTPIGFTNSVQIINSLST